MAKTKLIKYNGQTHAGPNEGIPIDYLGNPAIISNNPTIGLTEDGEVARINPDRGTVIFSKKNGFANRANKISSRFKSRLGKNLSKKDKFAENSLDRELDALANEQETFNSKKNKTTNKFNDGVTLSNPNTQQAVDKLGKVGPWGMFYSAGKAVDKSLFQRDEAGAFNSDNAAFASYMVTDPGQSLSQVGSSFKEGKIGQGISELLVPGIAGVNANKAIQKQQSDLEDEQNLNMRKSMFASNLKPTVDNIPTFSDGVKLPKYYDGTKSLQESVSPPYRLNPLIGMSGTENIAPLQTKQPGLLDINRASYDEPVGLDSLIPGQVNQSYEEDQTQPRIDLFKKNLPYVGAQTATTVLGNMALANRFGKSTRTEDVTTTPIRPERVDYGASRRELGRQTDLAKRSSIRRSAGLSGGARRSNLAATNIGLNRNLGSAFSQSYENQANQNANLRFQAARANAGQDLTAEQINVGARNLGRREAAARRLGLTSSAIGGLQQGLGDIRDLNQQDAHLNRLAARTGYTVDPKTGYLTPYNY